jgi:hypothetical protein
VLGSILLMFDDSNGAAAPIRAPRCPPCLQARNPATGAAITGAPLVAWFNGGPGCSSMFGMFFEHGPFTINSTMHLVPNNFTWAGAANMLYIDQPIGTGASYSGVSRMLR